MKVLNATELLLIWENGLHQSLIEKSLHLLAAAYSEPDVKSLALLSIGKRDRRLLQLRKSMFGSRLFSVANCPECSGTVEWEMNLEGLNFKPHQESAAKEFTLQVKGYDVRYRLVNSLDVLKALAHPQAYNTQKILSGCILQAQHDQQAYNPDDLPAEVFEAMDMQMEKEEPQADIQLHLKCPDCLHKWQAPFDIMSYLWTEIDEWAKRLLKDVALLARAFAWSERDILCMTAQRRQMYLQLLRT